MHNPSSTSIIQSCKDESSNKVLSRSLAGAYGDRAARVTEIAEQAKLGRRLVRGHPQLEAEVRAAVRESC